VLLFVVLSRERAKLSYRWQPAAAVRLEEDVVKSGRRAGIVDADHLGDLLLRQHLGLSHGHLRQAQAREDIRFGETLGFEEG
jgi:hypothetical protein